MKKGLKIAANVLVWLFVVFAVITTIVAFSSTKNENGVAIIFGKMPISIVSDSMSPTFKTGDLIFSKSLTAQEKAGLAVDDIITYKVDLNGDGYTELNTHRIVEVRSEGGFVYYTTKGDNVQTNPVADAEEVRYENVVGIYSGNKIAVLGGILTFLQTSTGFLVCIVIPLLLFLLYEVYNFIKVMVTVKSEKQNKEYEEEIKKRAIEEYLSQQNAASGTQDKKPADADKT